MYSLYNNKCLSYGSYVLIRGINEVLLTGNVRSTAKKTVEKSCRIYTIPHDRLPSVSEVWICYTKQYDCAWTPKYVHVMMNKEQHFMFKLYGDRCPFLVFC